MIYGWNRVGSAEKQQIFIMAEPVAYSGSAGILTLSVLNDFPEDNPCSVESDYTFTASDTPHTFKVTSYNSNLCNSLSFSISVKITHTRTFAQNAVDCRLQWRADDAELSRYCFTIVSGAAPHTRCVRKVSSGRFDSNRRVFASHQVLPGKGVLRL